MCLKVFSEKVKQLQEDVSTVAANPEDTRHIDVVKRATDLKRVWERFMFRAENRKHVLTMAWTFFKYIDDVRQWDKTDLINIVVYIMLGQVSSQ